jgi:ribosomal protein S25
MTEKKDTITLSINKKVLKDLREESESQQISLNSRVNAVLTKY